MLETSDISRLTGNVERLYSRHVTYSAFLLGSPIFNGVTSSKLTPICCGRTALHFYQHYEFAFQALSCLLHLSVSCLCLSQLLQRSFCFKRAKIYLCPQSCLWSDATKLLLLSLVLFNKRLYQMKTSSWWEKKQTRTLLCIGKI